MIQENIEGCEVGEEWSVKGLNLVSDDSERLTSMKYILNGSDRYTGSEPKQINGLGFHEDLTLHEREP